MNRFKINQKGFWESENGIGHIFDKSLSNQLINFLKDNNIETVVDFGCGLGNYSSSMISSGMICEAYDGNPNTPTLTKGLGKVLDLSNPFDLDKKFDCVLSLEVGEHIPKEYEQIFIDNICNHTKNLLILSWAVIGQTGDGHVNCQNNDYVVNEMEKRGFNYDDKNSLILRDSITNAPWFRNTIMVFRKK
jgi:cyclopropane fatty-acyl-phospholipid synthase-like methyltransferase